MKLLSLINRNFNYTSALGGSVLHNAHIFDVKGGTLLKV